MAALDDAECDRRSEAGGPGRPFTRKGAAQQQRLPPSQDRRADAIDWQQGEFGQASLEWQHGPGHELAIVRQSVERNGGFDVEGADASAPQFDHMAVATERAAEVPRNR